MLLTGVHQDAKPAALAKLYPGMNATREFTPNVISPGDLVKKMTAVCADTWAAGMTAVWSFKPDPQAVAAGAFVKPLQAAASYLRANPDKRTYVCIWHEPQNDDDYFARPEDFTRLFNSCHDALKAAHPGVTTVQSDLGYRFADRVKGGISDADAPRWRSRADILCGDFYSGRSFPLGQILPEMSAFRRWHTYLVGAAAPAADAPHADWIAWAVAQGCPPATANTLTLQQLITAYGKRRWGVTERGFVADPNDPVQLALRENSMRREAAWFAGQDPEILMLWATAGAEKDPKLLWPDPAAARAAATIISTAQARAAAVALAHATAAPAAVTRTIGCPLCAATGKYTFTA